MRFLNTMAKISSVSKLKKYSLGGIFLRYHTHFYLNKKMRNIFMLDEAIWILDLVFSIVVDNGAGNKYPKNINNWMIEKNLFCTCT